MVYPPCRCSTPVTSPPGPRTKVISALTTLKKKSFYERGRSRSFGWAAIFAISLSPSRVTVSVCPLP